MDGKYALIQLLNGGTRCDICPWSLFRKIVRKQFILRSLNKYNSVTHEYEQTINNINNNPLIKIGKSITNLIYY